MKQVIIQRFEHDYLRVGEKPFTKDHFKPLVDFNEKHGDQFFTVGNNRIKFKNFVGVLQIGGLTIEILPKLDRQSPDVNLMKGLLIQMLHRTGSLPLEKLDSASLTRVPGNLFELYLRLFIQEVRGIISHGIPKHYSRIQFNEKFLRGRLLPHQQLLHNLIHKERFFVEHQRYSIDHKFNQILKKALKIISRLPLETANDAESILPFFDDVTDCEINSSVFSNLKYIRNTECYRTAMCLAELIITNFQPDLQYGDLNINAILFDMNKLFENYITSEITRHIRKSRKGISVTAQASRDFLDNPRKNIRPDILIRYPNKNFVLDIKWKLLNDWNVADADLKQLYAYSLQFNAEKVFLVYPSSHLEESKEGCFKECEIHAERPIAFWKIPLVKGRGLHKEIGKMIIDQLDSTIHLPCKA